MKKIITIFIVVICIFAFKLQAQKIDSLNVSGSADTIYVHAEYGSIAPGSVIYFKCSDVGFGGPSIYSPHHFSLPNSNAVYDFAFGGLILSNNYCIRAVLTDTGSVVMDFRDSCLVLTTDISEYINISTFNLYPNPVSFGENLNIDVPKEMIAKVYNISGQLVMEERLVAHRNEIAQNLERGFYILSLDKSKQKFVVR